MIDTWFKRRCCLYVKGDLQEKQNLKTSEKPVEEYKNDSNLKSKKELVK